MSSFDFGSFCIGVHLMVIMWAVRELAERKTWIAIFNLVWSSVFLMLLVVLKLFRDAL